MNEEAPEGMIFVCAACGKTARWRYGFDENGRNDPEASPGWDESCMMWSTLCHSPREAGKPWQAVAIVPRAPDAPEKRNAGKLCDTAQGPCACGAWHDPSERQGAL